MDIIDYDSDSVLVAVSTCLRDPEEIEQEWQDRFREEFKNKDPWDYPERRRELGDQLAGDLRENVGMPRSGLGALRPSERRYKFETLAKRCHIPIGNDGWRDAVLEAVRKL